MEHRRFFNDDDVALIEQISDEMDANPEKYRGQGVASGIQEAMFEDVYNSPGAMFHMAPSTHKAYMKYAMERRKKETDTKHDAYIRGLNKSLWK